MQTSHPKQNLPTPDRQTFLETCTKLFVFTWLVSARPDLPESPYCCLAYVLFLLVLWYLFI